MALDEEQIAFFKEEGYLILKGFIDPQQVAEWRGQFWRHVGADPHDPASWPDSYVIEGFGVDPAFGQLPQMQSAIAQLGGGKFAGGGGSMLVHWPSGKDEWAWPGQGHIDGYGPGGWSGGFMLGATTYLDDVEDRGGAFTFWPRSHGPVQDFFREFPEQIDGSFRERDDWEQRQWGLFSDLSTHGPQQFVARAGDVILWHCFMCHTGSGNIRQRPRLGVFARWHHEDRESMRYEVPEDMWKYWAI